MKIAITGASGHIGNNLCRSLIDKGYQLKVLINKTDEPLEGLDVEKVYGNILDAAALDKLIKDAEYVFHTAALISIGNEMKSKVNEINIKGTENVVEACMKHKVKRLIHFSSIHALHCDDSNQIVDENNTLADSRDLNYNKSKARGEAIVLEACAKGLDAIILNPTSVVGPYDFMPSLIGQMIIKIAREELPFLIEGGYHFVDVRDVAQAAINAMILGKSGNRYLLTSQWKSLIEIAKIIANQAEKKTPIRIPTIIAWIGLPFMYLYSKVIRKKLLYTKDSIRIVTHSLKNVENKKAIKELNFTPRTVEETFIDTYFWFKNNNRIIH